MHVSVYTRLFSEPFRITEPEFVHIAEDARTRGDAPSECSALIDLAFARIHMGQASKALEPIRRAIDLAQEHGLRVLHLQARLWRDCAIHFSNDHTTQTLFDELIVELAENGLTDLVPVAMVVRAREHDRSNERDLALKIINDAFVVLKDVADPYVRSFVYRLAGMILRSAEQFTQAFTVFEEARSAAEHAGLLSQLARTLSAMGSAYVADQRPKDGLTELLVALELYRKLEINDWYVAETNLNLAILHDQGHDHTKAIEYATRSKELFEAAGDLTEAARAENVMGVLFERMGDLDKALRTYQDADAKFRITQSRGTSATLPYANAANVLRIRGRSKEALDMLTEALERSKANGSAIGESQANAFLGSLFDEDNSPLYDPKKAEEHLLRGYQLDHLRGGSASPLILEQLAQYYEHHKDFERALRFTKELFDYRDRVRDESVQRRISQLEDRRRIEEAYKIAEIEQLRNVELKAAQTLLVESEKMASLGQLTAGIAHEINNPVTFIASSVAPLRRDLLEYEAIGGTGPLADELRAEIFELLDGIETGARRTAEIVKSLRTFSRLDEGSIKKTDIVSGIESTLTLLNTRIRGVVEIVKEFDEVPHIECRAGQINQVIMNILSNAIDALEKTINPTIRIGVRRAGANQISITIADNGNGIPEESLPRLFEPFYTTKDVGKGTGLGLSISYGIIERHHGRIEVHNDNGAVFSITLPIAQPASDTI
ncbi:MAG: tetratricopeptide repeat protein [Ignavibacteria bacterium]|nr:tetratricopeptide repeat protein [Ignavibacteria bacterium]MBK7184705.1 tetratricopeptide repeat protein [Ignavibacteria bacterium]MBK9182924.1 tetratricopeptide repeat protein [Ignavibacteria bacterium]MBP6510091.1 tetratricopeptide repeat protein [Candidatus Kapabacteria bacterium]